MYPFGVSAIALAERETAHLRHVGVDDPVVRAARLGEFGGLELLVDQPAAARNDLDGQHRWPDQAPLVESIATTHHDVRNQHGVLGEQHVNGRGQYFEVAWTVNAQYSE